MASHMDPGRDVVFDGDRAVMVTLGHCIDPKINDACVRLGNRVRAANLAGVRDLSLIHISEPTSRRGI